MNPAPFYAYARERYKIMLRRVAGQPAPWTEDPILRDNRFCNVFREDDKTTRWIRQTITDLGYGGQIVDALFIARWFNRIETVARLLPPEGCEPPYFIHNMLYSWDPAEVKRRLTGVKPLVTGAYMVRSVNGIDKLSGIIQCINGFYDLGIPDKVRAVARETRSLEAAHAALMEAPIVGPFTAYEVVTDLRHTNILRDATDVMTWANPGPGAARGLCRVHGLPLDALRRERKADYNRCIGLMCELLRHSRNPDYWPRYWPQWELREVEHTLCEFDKYERVRLGDGRMKQGFPQGRG